MTGTSALVSRRYAGRPRSLAALLAVLATLFGTLIIVVPTPASAAGNGEWSVDPHVPDGTTQNARRYFFLEGAPGTSIPDIVTLHNTSPKALTMMLFGADAFNTPRDGGFALRTVTDQQTDIGTWVQVAPENRTVTLQPNEKKHIPFNIVIPPNATPGDHPGAIVALNTDIEGQQQQGQVKVNIKRQIGARVYLRVQGAMLPAMDVRDVQVTRDAGFGEFFGSSDATITYEVLNRGNVILRPEFELEATGLFGRSLTKKKEPAIEILPGAKVVKTVHWKDAPRLDRVSIKVGAASADDDQQQPRIEDTASTSYTAVPWPGLLVLALILIAGGVGWNLWRNHGKGGKGGDPADPDAPKGPTDDTTVLPPVPAEPTADETPVANAETSGEEAAKDAAEPAKAVEAEPVEAEPPVVAAPILVKDTAEDGNAKDDDAEGKSTETDDTEIKAVGNKAVVDTDDTTPEAATPAESKADEASTAPGDPEPATAGANPETAETAAPAAPATAATAAATKSTKSTKRGKGKRPPATPGAEEPAADETENDAAGVGR